MAEFPRPYSEPSFTGLIGVARVDITPPVGIYARNWGAAAHDVADGIHRPLYATALTLQSEPDESPFVLIAFDLGWWKSIEDEWYVRSGVLEALSLDPARLLMNLSHTHSCPAMCRDDADQPGGHLIAPYMAQVRAAMIEATRQALQARQPATLSWGTGKCDLARNRDIPDPAKPRIVLGFNPDMPADDTLVVGRATDRAGKIIAVVANYACHPTTLAWQNHLISPDFIGAFNEVVEASTGGLSLFIQGASGELEPKECFTGDTGVADKHGRQLGYATLSALESMLPPDTELRYSGVVESGAPLATWDAAPHQASTTLKASLTEVAIPLKDWPSVEEIERQLEQTTDRALQERLVRKRRVRRVVGDGATAQAPLWVWQIGDAIVVAQMNEAYSQLQTVLRRRFPDRTIIVTNVTNGTCGYLPPAELYDEDIYQVWQTPFERGCLQLTIDAATAAINDILAW